MKYILSIVLLIFSQLAFSEIVLEGRWVQNKEMFMSHPPNVEWGWTPKAIMAIVFVDTKMAIGYAETNIQDLNFSRYELIKRNSDEIVLRYDGDNWIFGVEDGCIYPEPPLLYPDVKSYYCKVQ